MIFFASVQTAEGREGEGEGEERGGEGREGEGRGGRCVHADAVFTASADGKNPSMGETASTR
jgi:hypothetical protein